MKSVAEMAWPVARLPEAIDVLARLAGLKPARADTAPSPQEDGHGDEEGFESWLEWTCARIGIEMESVEVTGADFSNLLRTGGPAVLRYRAGNESSILLLLKGSARRVHLVGPDLRVSKYPIGLVQEALYADVLGPVTEAVEVLMQQVGIHPASRSRVVRLLAEERLADQRMDGCWILRMPPARSFLSQLAVMHCARQTVGMLAAFGALYLLEIVGWMLIGQGALEGRLDYGWLIAWILLLLTMVPIQLIGTWLQGTFAIDFGIWLKKRLLSGALSINIDEVRKRGVGQLLGHVIESQALESLALNGGFSVLVAAIELSLAAWVLAWGAGGVLQVLTLLLWIVGMLTASWFYYQRLRGWTSERIALTHQLIEQMVGHRTRLAQEVVDERHVIEDQRLGDFLHVSRDLDKSFIPLAWGVPRGWLIVGLLGLIPAFIWGRVDVLGLAVSVGGVLLAYRAFGEVGTGLSSLARAAVAWEIIAPLFNVGQQAEEVPPPLLIGHRTRRRDDAAAFKCAVIQARNLVYRYGQRAEPVLDGCNVTIYHGDRVLLQGASGGGKSTLAALLGGLRRPDSGLLMLNGLDRATLGQGWRRLSTVASQFHENHVFTGTVAFNLLMGRRWPATADDMAEATQLCEELGLGDLLSRMPSGLMQMVGETGWQLSHGERSRLFLARALLQKAELVVLDESFAALDPETLTQCLRCALLRAPTLVVIAHP